MHKLWWEIVGELCEEEGLELLDLLEPKVPIDVEHARKVSCGLRVEAAVIKVLKLGNVAWCGWLAGWCVAVG